MYGSRWTWEGSLERIPSEFELSLIQFCGVFGISTFHDMYELCILFLFFSSRGKDIMNSVCNKWFGNLHFQAGQTFYAGRHGMEYFCAEDVMVTNTWTGEITMFNAGAL